MKSEIERGRPHRLRERAITGTAFSRYWHEQARRVREQVAQLQGDRREGLLPIAEQYDLLADKAPRRQSGLKKVSPPEKLKHR